MAVTYSVVAVQIRHREWQLVMVVLPGCPSRHEPARSQGLPIPADNLPSELARVCDSVGKLLAWRGLDAAFPSHFVMVTKVSSARGGWGLGVSGAAQTNRCC